MNMTIVRKRAEELEAELRAIDEAAGDRRLNPAEQARWDELDGELRDVREDLARESRKDRVSESRARWGSLSVDSTPSTVAPAAVARMGGQEARSAALRILDGAYHLAARQGDHVDALLRSHERGQDGAQVAKLILMTESPEYRSAFQRVVTEAHPVLTEAEAQALRAVQEYRAASSTDNAGGYGVPALIDPTIILTAQQSGNPFWDLATIKTITTDQWKGISSAGVTWSWDSEAAEVSDDAPTLAQPAVPVYTARGFVPYSLEIGMDYPGFAGEIMTLLGEGYAELTAQAFATGPGSTAPTGILTALDANTNVEVLVTTDGLFAAADIDKVWAALPDRAKANATWVMNSQVNSYIAAWGDTYGGRTVDMTGVPTTLRQRPVKESSYFPTFTGTTGAANILVVGDFRKFIIAQRAGMAIEPIPHLFGVTNGLPTGQRGMFAWARVGSDAADDTAFRLLQNA